MLSRLSMLVQWRSGLRIPEALALEPSDLLLDSELPALRVRRGHSRVELLQSILHTAAELR